MNFKIKKENLLKYLNHVIKGISSKNLIPILNCIKFDLTAEGLYLLSTDNEIAIKTFIDKKYIEDGYTCGQFVVYGKYIYEIIRKLPNEIIEIEEVIDSKIFISTTNSSFSLNCNNIDEFPNLELEDSKNPIVLNSKILKNLVNQTSFAASTQESRPNLTGINVQIKDNLLTFRATDSYRLAQKSIVCEFNDEDVNIIIPTKNMVELTRMLDDEEDVNIHIFNNKIIFKFANIIMMSRLINRSFPDVTKLIPEDFKIKVTIPTHEFYSLLDRVSLFSSEEENNNIKLECIDSNLIVKSNIPEIGNVEEKLTIKKSTNEDFKIAFSSKYMMEAIKSFSSDEIEFSFNEEIKPIILKSNSDENLLQLIVPMKTY